VSAKASPTLIGAFVLGALILVVIGLLLFGGGRFFTERVSYVAYFDESISGLSDGAPVNFRGVKVGAVRRIEVQLDARDLSVKIPVYIDLERRRIREVGGTIPQAKVIPELIKRGLRAQLQLQSIVTGQLYVQLDFHPHRPAVFSEPDAADPELPTIPSSMQELTKTLESLSLQDMVKQAQQVLAGIHALVISSDVSEILSGINRLVNSSELTQLIARADEAVIDLRTLVKNIDGRVGGMSTSVESTLAEVRQTLNGVQEALAAAKQSLSIAGEDSPVRYELEQTLGELAAAARSIRVLAEYLESHPDSLLRGKPGEP
jgi:paraquat-inducible protein B